MELREVPAWNLADNVVQGRFKECRGFLCDGILQVEKAVAQAEFRRHKCQRIACSLGGECRRTAETGVHLDYPVVHRIRIEGILHIALADYSDVAHNLDCQLAEIVILFVGERLRRSDHNAFACVDSKRVEILHIADSDAVVIAVPYHLVLYFLPSLEGFLDKNLRRERECLLTGLLKFLLIVAESGSETSEGVCSPDNHRIAQSSSGFLRLLESLGSVRLDCLDINLVQFLHEKFTVLRVNDRLHRCTEHLHAVAFQNTALVEFHATVQRCLATEGKKNTLRTFLQNDLLDKIGSDRQEVDFVCNLLRSLYRCNVRVDQNRLNPLFLQCLQCL